MDRTLIESQQLDFLFEQMLALRRQQDGTGAAAPPAAVLGADGYGASLDIDAAGVAADVLLQSPQLEYADASTDFCEEAQQMWTGTQKGLGVFSAPFRLSLLGNMFVR
jgi:hypothetical protein